MRQICPVFILLFFFSAVALAQTGHHPQQDTMVYLNEINIMGKTMTKKTVILRELSVRKGAEIRLSHLDSLTKVNTERLYSISIFNEVHINWKIISTDSINMYIRVKDRFPVFPEGHLEFADRNFNVWWKEKHHDLKRINIGLTLTDNNFRGKHELLGITGQVGYTQKIGLSYEIPFVDKAKKNGFGISFFGLQNKEIAYKTDSNKLSFFRSENSYEMRRTDFSLWYVHRPKYAATHTLKFTWQHYWINRAAVGLNPDFLGHGLQEANVMNLAYKYQWNGVDNWNYPLTGQRFIGSLVEKLLFPDKQFQSSVQLHYERYLNPHPKWYLAFIFRSRFSFPMKQPYIFQKNLGYDYDYIRGFEYYVIDGNAFALGRIDVKRCLVNYKLHLPIRYFEMIPIRIYLKAFADAGYSYNKYPENDFLNNRLLYSGGLGIDIVTLYDIKFRIEYTFNSLGEKGLFLHKSGE